MVIPEHALHLPADAKFRLGNVVTTLNAARRLNPIEVADSLARHVRGDWGEVKDRERDANDSALEHGGPLTSRYRTSAGVWFQIITEPNRSGTTIRLTGEH